MGLDIYPGGAQWSYTGFARFRKRLAAEEDITLEAMRGFGGALKWDSVRTSLAPLLNHSDCDGYLDPWDCEEMLPRLREIEAKWKAERAPVSGTYDVIQLGSLIAGFEHCVEHECAVSFR